MTREDLIKLAREATNNEPIYCRQEFTFSRGQLERFAELVAKTEREACAKLCDHVGYAHEVLAGSELAFDLAAAIRARGAV